MASSNPQDPQPSAGASYDETPYLTQSFPQTHPDKLCAMARLFGLAAPEPSQSRVLELGCADGANLLPMAQHAPQARFLGVDVSAKQVAAGQAAITAAGLTNVEIRQQDILEFPAAEGKFDYIIVHGIFSWVPEDVRAKVLAICREHLSDNGVAYVSYNAFPGWSMRMALRDMALFHTHNIKDSTAKVQQARALTAFLAETVPTENNPYGMLLKQELERMKARADNHLRHDLLEEVNQPFYFHEFIGRAIGAGLQYLGETSLDQMLASNFPAKTQETLKKVGTNLIAQEQYMDFVRNRNFRQTLLCRREAKLNRNIAPALIKDFYFTSVIVKPAAGTLDFKLGVAHGFKVRNSQAVLNADNTFVKAVFDTLADHDVRRASFPELLKAAQGKVAGFISGDPSRIAAVEEDALTKNLLHLYSIGAIDIYASRPAVELSVPEKPAATPLARYQSLHAPLVTTRTHVGIGLDLLARYILAACDGERDSKKIVEYLGELTKTGKLRLTEGEKQVEDETRVGAVLENRVALVLPRLAAVGFF